MTHMHTAKPQLAPALESSSDEDDDSSSEEEDERQKEIPDTEPE